MPVALMASRTRGSTACRRNISACANAASRDVCRRTGRRYQEFVVANRRGARRHSSPRAGDVAEPAGDGIALQQFGDGGKIPSSSCFGSDIIYSDGWPSPLSEVNLACKWLGPSYDAS